MNAARKGRSDYLVYGVENRFYPGGMKPYPEGEERKAINAAFDNLFQTIQHEPVKSEKGESVRMFSAEFAATDAALLAADRAVSRTAVFA